MNYGQQINLFHVFAGILFLVVSFAALQGAKLPRIVPIAGILLAGGALAYHAVSLVKSLFSAQKAAPAPTTTNPTDATSSTGAAPRKL